MPISKQILDRPQVDIFCQPLLLLITSTGVSIRNAIGFLLHFGTIRPKATMPIEKECNAILAEKNFDYKIKPKQSDVISSLLKKNDTFAVLATGYGKSICYVLPPLIMDKVNIIMIMGNPRLL